MADRLDYYFRQKVTEAELDLAFELLERADRNLAADIGLYGIIAGAEPAPHSPVPDLTIDLTAPARAYDNLGQRIFFGTGQVVDCSVDHTGIPTDVPLAGEERWLGVFVRFDRLLSDLRTDGNSPGHDKCDGSIPWPSALDLRHGIRQSGRMTAPVIGGGRQSVGRK